MRQKEGNKENDILDASVRVFSSLGYSDAKIHKIAEEAGVASGTVYLYFKNKEEILLRIFEAVWKKIFELTEIINDEENEPVKKFNCMIDSVFEIFNSDPALATVFVNEQHHIMKCTNEKVMNNYMKFLGLCEKVLNEGIRHKVFNKEIDSLVFSNFFFGGIRYLLQQWAQDQDKYSLETIRKNIKCLVLNGICC